MGARQASRGAGAPIAGAARRASPASLEICATSARDAASGLPPGEMGFSLRRTHRFQRNTLQMLLDYYERYGPIFTFRSLHRRIVAMIGPEANHFVTVSGAEHFSWRRGMFGEQLTPLIGDGLITTDWEYHDRARRIMMPAFHRRRLRRGRRGDGGGGRARAGRLARRARWSTSTSGSAMLAMSIAMRALVGLDPRRRRDRARGRRAVRARAAPSTTPRAG